MVRTTILLDDDLMLEVKRLAKDERTTATNVIRHALKSYIGEHRKTRSLSFANLGKSGHSHVSRDAESLLRRKADTREGW